MKKEFSIVLLFSLGSPFVHECSANFRSLLPIFYGFSSKLPEIAKFSIKLVTFCHFEYFSAFLLQNSVGGGGGNFQFSADFHEPTLSMTSYHVTQAINGHF